MLDLFDPRPPPVALLSLGRVLPLLFTVLALFFLEASTEVEVPRVSARPEPVAADTRLVVFWIDSLAVADMDNPAAMTRLKARLPRGLHGPVRECMDAMSVPCVTAASTGLDRFSFFSMVRNFGGSSGVGAGSVFRALQEQGVRLGFIGDSEVSSAFVGFDWLEIQRDVDDRHAVARGLEALDAERLGLVVIHLRQPDELSHKLGARHPAYDEALELIDREVDAAMSRLRPNDHVVIFGDHGHTDDGRHFAGLDVPTYGAFFGPRFARPMARPMAITDHGSLWAPVFGLRFGEIPWIEAYLSGAEVPPQEGLPPVSSGNAALPLWAVLVGLIFSAIVSVPHRIRWLVNPEWRSLLYVLLALGAVAFACGLFFTSYRPLLYFKPRDINIGIGMATGLLGLALVWPARRIVHFERDVTPATGLAALFMGGTVILALPTVYKFGGLFTALTGLVLMALVAGVLALNERRWARAALCGLLVGLLLMVWNPQVRNFAVRSFLVFTDWFGAVPWVAVVALAVLAFGFGAGPRWRPWTLGAAAGLAFAAVGLHLPPHVFIVPCVALFPLVMAAHRRPSLGPLVALVAPPALLFFFREDPVRLGPVACALAAFPVWARARGHAPPLERGIAIVLLLWLTLWTMVGCRVNGLDFQYFFRWLPEGAAVEATWGRNAILTTFLYLSIPTLGLLLAARALPAGLGPTLPVVWHFARMKLGLVLVFIVGFSLGGSDAGPFITADVLMEAGVWAVVLVLLAPLPFRAPVSSPAR